MPEKMTKAEREDLQRLLRDREKVQIAAAKEMSAELMADFESQLAARYSFDDDAVWEAAVKEAEREVKSLGRPAAPTEAFRDKKNAHGRPYSTSAL